MKLFNFNQNNSGGSFVTDENVTYDTLFESKTSKGANKKAKEVGIYFNGCEEGYDCSCCGDRWSKAYHDTPDNYSVFEFPDKESAIAYFEKEEKGMFRTEKIIHFKDGTKIKIQLK
jgi:hypothetical protein